MGQRRPVGARELGASRAIAHWLATRGIGANAISLAGLGFALLAGAILAFGPDRAAWPWLAAAVLVELRLACNMFDGMVALERGAASKLGELYNEIPDRVADAAVLIGLGYAAEGAIWLGYVAALLAVFTAYVRVFGVSLGAPADFRGPMAKPTRMHLVALTALICAGTNLAGSHDDRIVTLALAVIALGALVTALRRIMRLADSIR